jgi:diguanylate cyclase (GGDEF)-like protein
MKVNKFSHQNMTLFEPLFNRVLIIAALVNAILSGVYFFHGGQELLLSLNLMSFFSCSFIYLLRKKSSTEFRVILSILVLLSFGLIYVLKYGFSGIGILTLIFANTLSALFLSSFLFGLIPLITLLSITIISWMIYRHDLVYSDRILGQMNEPLYWFFHTISFTAFILLLYMIISNLKKRLDESFTKMEDQLAYIEKQAYFDPLTQLPNRNYFLSHIDQRLDDEPKGLIVLFDAVDFKSINTIYGTETGDQVLRAVGEILTLYKQPDSLVARLGSNEFVLQTNIRSIETMSSIIRSAESALKEVVSIDHTLAWHVVFVQYPEHGSNFKTLYENATIALKHIKEEKKNFFVTYDPQMRSQFKQEAQIKQQVNSAFENDEFYSVFQKKVDVKTNAMVGLEALSRWESKTLGYVPPNIFIPILTQSGKMYHFSRMMMAQAIKEFASAEHLPKSVSLSLNISPIFFAHPDFVNCVLRTLEDAQFDGHRLILEITEDMLIHDLEDIQEKIKVLKAHDIRLSLDDFGTGYSSLKYLTAIAFDEIKIDKSFIDHILTKREDYMLLESIIALTKILNYTVVAEGVETEDQVHAVSKAGCKIIQGYYYDRPKRIHDIKP